MLGLPRQCVMTMTVDIWCSFHVTIDVIIDIIPGFLSDCSWLHFDRVWAFPRQCDKCLVLVVCSLCEYLTHNIAHSLLHTTHCCDCDCVNEPDYIMSSFFPVEGSKTGGGSQYKLRCKSIFIT